MLCSENKGADQLLFSHMQKASFLMTRLILSFIYIGLYHFNGMLSKRHEQKWKKMAHFYEQLIQDK